MGWMGRARLMVVDGRVGTEAVNHGGEAAV